jgi:hypothetical protein
VGPRFLKVTFSNGQTAHLFNALIVDPISTTTSLGSAFQVTADATRTNETANYYFSLPLYTPLGGNDSISIVFPYGYNLN